MTLTLTPQIVLDSKFGLLFYAFVIKNDKCIKIGAGYANRYLQVHDIYMCWE